MATATPMRISPLGRVEGDLDLRIEVTDRVVTNAWTEASMFRGFEIILKGKDPQAGLIVTPRICGICGGSHLYKACYALDTAWKTHVPQNATLVRNIAQVCETLQSIPRWFYALFAIDLTHKNYAKTAEYDEVVKRFAPFVGTSYEKGVTLSGKPVEVYAIFGGQWPHSSFMVPGGVMCAPNLSDVTRSIAILDYWKREWLEKTGWDVASNAGWRSRLGTSYGNGLMKTTASAIPIVACSSVSQKLSGSISLAKVVASTWRPAPISPGALRASDDRRPQCALINRAGVYDGKNFHDFNHLNVRESTAHSFYQGDTYLHPWDGVTEPIDPQVGHKQGKYSWAKSPRYEVLVLDHCRSRQGLYPASDCGAPGGLKHQDYDPLFMDAMKAVGPSVLVRVMARMHEACKYYKLAQKWLSELQLHDRFYNKPEELASGKGFGSTEAARGSLSDWIVIEKGRIENYQVVTPTAWNIGPQDSKDVHGPMEQAFIGSEITDPTDPIEMGHVARSFDSCLVCTVHTYDGKTGGACQIQDWGARLRSWYRQR